MFGNTFSSERRLLARLVGVQRALEEGVYDSITFLEEKLRFDRDQVLCEEEVYWYQQSRCE